MLNSNIAEANIQAELYHQLHLLDIPCQLEYPYKIDDRIIVADIVILEDNKPILNVEVKNHKRDRGQTQLWCDNDYKPTKQIKRYLTLDVPLFLCESHRQIDKTIEFIKLWVNRDVHEMYKLYPTKVSVINKRLP